MTNSFIGSQPTQDGMRVLTPTALDTLQVDLLIFAVGYEQRSSYFANFFRNIYATGIGLRFGDHEELSYPNNLAKAEANPKVTVELAASAEDAARVVADALRSQLRNGETLVVSLDISSFPRAYIAEIYSSISLFARAGNSVIVHFVYSPAEFTAPPVEHGPVVSFGPVTPEFAGLGEVDLGLAAVIGLGYEPDLALSAQQLLDPVETWLAVPRSADERFDVEIQKSNRVLLDVVDTRNRWTWNVEAPFASFVELESVVSGLRRDRNVVIVPLGPKLLVVLALLVAEIHGASIGVWRLTAGGLRVAHEQIATGRVASIAIELRGNAKSTDSGG